MGCSKRLCGPYCASFHKPYHAVVNQKAEILDVKCNFDILYTVGPAQCDKKRCSQCQTLFLHFRRIWEWNYLMHL